MWEQRHNSWTSVIVLDPPELEVAVQKTVQAIMQDGPGLAAKMWATLSHLRSLRAQMQQPAEWFNGLPKQVASAYTYDGDKIVQMPMLIAHAFAPIHTATTWTRTCALVSHL